MIGCVGRDTARSNMKTMSSCFAALRQIRSIRRTTTRPVLKSLVVALVLSQLDYSSATLAGLPMLLLDRLQSVLMPLLA